MTKGGLDVAGRECVQCYDSCGFCRKFHLEHI